MITDNLIRQNKGRAELFRQVKAGNYFLSIQGSHSNYSLPRVDDLPSSHYSSMEIAVFNKKNDWFNVHKSSVIKNYPRFKELGFQSGNLPVAGYVPVSLIDDFYNYLSKLSEVNP